MLYHDSSVPELWSAPLDGDRKPLLVGRTLSGTVDQARFSSDGRWVAYNANESGRYEVYVVPFPPTGDKWQISTAGGVQPMWRADGKELFYLTLDGVMTAADIKTGRAIEVGTPHPLFRTHFTSVRFEVEGYAVTGDGQRFLIRTPIPGAAPPSMTVVLNWAAGLKK